MAPEVGAISLLIGNAAVEDNLNAPTTMMHTPCGEALLV
jgi:hypothetical protein